MNTAELEISEFQLPIFQDVTAVGLVSSNPAAVNALTIVVSDSDSDGVPAW